MYKFDICKQGVMIRRLLYLVCKYLRIIKRYIRKNVIKKAVQKQRYSVLKKYLQILFIMIFFSVANLFSEEIIGNGELKITVDKVTEGAKITSIKNNDLELMDASATSSLFLLDINGLFITSINGWDSVLINNDGSHCEVILSQPTNSKLSDSLEIKVTLDVTGKASDWDISINGLLNNSLNQITFPYINILAPGNDYFLIPKYSGKLFKNPKGSAINLIQSYPRGWSSTMQFSAYYNDNYGIYFGTHDPKASLKSFIVKSNNKNGLLINNQIPAPDKGLAGNDYEMPGEYHFEIFQGDWYDAAQIYKKWASTKADYWPEDTQERRARQDSIGQVGLWMEYYDVQTPETAISSINRFREYIGFPIGVHWYNWNYNPFDDNYPIYFPERDGMSDVISETKEEGNIYFMPYINGRLFETDLDEYPTLGYPYAAKNADGNVYTSVFSGNTFANMCPTQRPWQDILVDAVNQLTCRIGTDAVYVDQVTASSVKECMDPTHGHTLGGGHFWRDGYYEMIKKMHSSSTSGSFITTEGCNDYLADVVDGFLTDGWTTDNLVPAFQAVYSGRVQLFGTRTGTGSYNDQSFYCKLAQAFVNGIQPGRFHMYIIDDQNAQANAKPYVRQIGRMRYKLRDFLAFGSMKKPIQLDRSNIPTITSTWQDYGQDVQVTISALQYSFWKNRQGNEAVLIFANASLSQSLDFTLNFTGSDYGFMGQLKVQKITQDEDGAIVSEENSFVRDLAIQPKEVFALLIKPDSVTVINERSKTLNEFKLEQNYPNPFNPQTKIRFSLPNAGNTNLEIYNVLGQKIAIIVNKRLLAGMYEYIFNGSALTSGLYYYKLQSGNYIEIKKMLLLK
jgi:hypothetical protein